MIQFMFKINFKISWFINIHYIFNEKKLTKTASLFH